MHHEWLANTRVPLACAIYLRLVADHQVVMERCRQVVHSEPELSAILHVDKPLTNPGAGPVQHAFMRCDLHLLLQAWLHGDGVLAEARCCGYRGLPETQGFKTPRHC